MEGDQQLPNADTIYDRYDDIFFDKGPSELTPIGLDIVAAGSFFGQMRCGGLPAYLDSPWSCLIDQVVPALTRMGMDQYARIASEMLKNWKTAGSSERAETDAIEEAFWKHYWRNPDGDGDTLDEAIVRHGGQH